MDKKEAYWIRLPFDLRRWFPQAVYNVSTVACWEVQKTIRYNIGNIASFVDYQGKRRSAQGMGSHLACCLVHRTTALDFRVKLWKLFLNRGGFSEPSENLHWPTIRFSHCCKPCPVYTSHHFDHVYNMPNIHKRQLTWAHVNRWTTHNRERGKKSELLSIYLLF